MGRMVTFSNENDLKDFLNNLQAGYGDRYSQQLWDHGFTTSDELANASEAVLERCGVLRAHVGNLRVKAGSAGAPYLLILQFSDCSVKVGFVAVASYFNKELPVICTRQIVFTVPVYFRRWFHLDPPGAVHAHHAAGAADCRTWPTFAVSLWKTMRLKVRTSWCVRTGGTLWF